MSVDKSFKLTSFVKTLNTATAMNYIDSLNVIANLVWTIRLKNHIKHLAMKS